MDDDLYLPLDGRRCGSVDVSLRRAYWWWGGKEAG
jgi:hypothetical protein